MSECTALLGQKSVFGGFQTVASAHALCQPTIVGLSISSQHPKVQNLIRIECILNRSEHRV